MGYYVQTTDCDIKIKQEDFEKCYAAMCALNDRDDLKSGGSYGGGVDANSPRPEGMNHHPARWFSWMSADYPSKQKTFQEIIQELGFDPTYSEDGDLVLASYDNKIGSEQLFFSAIAPWVAQDSYIDWRGEDGAEWRWSFDGATLKVLSCVKKVWA
jgi:hypothetical protein